MIELADQARREKAKRQNVDGSNPLMFCQKKDLEWVEGRKE